MVKWRISILGTGYVGLCTAIGFASKGHKIITSTHDPEKAASINKGIPPFYEPDLQDSLQRVIAKDLFRCTLDQEEAIQDTEITFIATATPSGEDGSINLQHIKNTTVEIGTTLKKKDTYHLVVVKSTVIPGTTQNIIKKTVEQHTNKLCGSDFGLCMNPEFLREGSALYDTLNPDRVVIGEHDKRSGGTLENFYRDLYEEKMPPLVRTNLANAELIKYANNAFLATKISFINTIANLSQKIPEADVTTIAETLGLDRRICPNFLKAGLGYGGSCFPKDIKALTAFSKSIGCNPFLLQAVENVNEKQPRQAIELIKKNLSTLRNKRIAILGLAFKPNTDDMREARSILIINELLREGAQIIAYDPMAISNAKDIFGNKIEFAASPIECLREADCCILVTEWEEFKKLTPRDFRQNMKRPLLIDGRRIYDPKEFSEELEFTAIGLGK